MAMGIATILASPPMGVLADRYGRRRLLLTSNFIMSVSIALFSVTRDPHLLVIVAVIMGICEAGCSTSSVALLAAKSGGTHRIPAFALLGFVSGTAFSLGGFTVPLVLIFEGIGFSSRDAHIALYVIMAVLSILSVLPVLKISETEGEGTGRPSAILSPRSRRIVFRFSLAGFIVALGTGVVIPLMTRWLFLMYGVPDTISGPALGIPGLLTTAGILAAPAIAKRGGIVRAIVLLQGFSGLLLVLMPFSPGFVLAVALSTGRTLSMDIVGSLQQSFITGSVLPEEQGAVAGVTSAIWRTPNTVSTAIGAGLMGAGFMDIPFYLASLLYGVSIIGFWLFFRRVQTPGEPAPG